jgi:hypothetical protein
MNAELKKWLRDMAMNEFCINGSVHAHNIDHLERWQHSFFWFTREAFMCFFWMMLCDIFLFIANVVMERRRYVETKR